MRPTSSPDCPPTGRPCTACCLPVLPGVIWQAQQQQSSSLGLSVRSSQPRRTEYLGLLQGTWWVLPLIEVWGLIGSKTLRSFKVNWECLKYFTKEHIAVKVKLEKHWSIAFHGWSCLLLCPHTVQRPGLPHTHPCGYESVVCPPLPLVHVAWLVASLCQCQGMFLATVLAQPYSTATNRTPLNTFEQS